MSPFFWIHTAITDNCKQISYIIKTTTAMTNNQNRNINSKLSSRKNKPSRIENILISFILLIIGTTVIILSISAHQNNIDYIIYINISYMILSSIDICFIFCSFWKLIITCLCKHNKSLINISIIHIFAIVSYIVTLTLSILGFLHYYNYSFINNFSYPFWLNIALISYSTFMILTSIILKILPPNHFNDIEVSLPYEPIHKNAPDYIHKYTQLHPYDRSTIKRIWHSFSHQCCWNIIKLGYKKPLEIWDCYNVPQTDHILSQCKVWDKYASKYYSKTSKCYATFITSNAALFHFPINCCIIF